MVGVFWIWSFPLQLWHRFPLLWFLCGIGVLQFEQIFLVGWFLLFAVLW